MSDVAAHKINILVVDDNPANLRLLAGILSERGYSVRPAAGGRTALAVVHHIHPDLILLDVMMPDIDGYTVCERLKADVRTQDIPIIFVSALHETIDKVRAFALGAVDYITKPFQADEVLARVHTHIALREARRQLEEKNTQLERANQELSHEIGVRVQAEAAIRRYAEEQAALYAVTAAASVLDPDELLSTTLEVVLSFLDSHAGWAMLPGATADDPPRVAAWRGIPEAFVALQETLPMRECPVCAFFADGADLPLGPFPLDAHAHPLFEILKQAGMRYQVSVPLRAGEQPLGILCIVWPASQTFEVSTNQSLLKAIGQQVGLALRNAQLYQAARQIDRLRMLNAIGVAAISSLELDTVLRQILALTCQALDVAEGTILLQDPDTHELVFALWNGASFAVLRGVRLAPGQGIVGWVVQHAVPVCVNDVYHDVRFHRAIDTLTHIETRSLVCAPLIHRDKVTGALEVVNKRRGEFEPEDVSFLEAAASIAAAAIENARLYAATCAQANRMALLNRIGQTLTATLDPAQVAEAALREVGSMVTADSVALLSADTEAGELCFAHVLLAGKPVEFHMCVPLGESLVGWALQHNEALLVEDAQQDPRFSARVDRYRTLQSRGMMVVPLRTAERALGVLEVVSSKAGVYTREEFDTLRAVASTLTIALENARLYEALKTLLHEREATQLLLIHTEKMAALGRMAASIAHEINNPLQSIIGCLDLAREDLLEGADVDGYLEMAQEEILRVTRTTVQMRDLYRMPSGERTLVDINTLIAQILELNRKRCQENNVRVVWTPTDDLPPQTLSVDQIKQVFINLLLNALEAMPDGGQIDVSTTYTKEPPGVSITVTDTGMGIPADILPRIFEPFHSTKPNGTGLGLPTSHTIVERHGGSISVESAADRGTTFRVWLPV
jgi:two-component system, NtrC family, sensor kinase